MGWSAGDRQGRASSRQLRTVACSVMVVLVNGSSAESAQDVASLRAARLQVKPIIDILVSLVSLGVLGAVGGRLGGAPMGRASLRVLLGGGAAMATTALIGRLLGVAGIG